ncbi:GNAT family N-acetyltransferase [Niabella ginsengisoli]|uniref:GNAT family N-acetyltransferase n=1 Tax=Niabella ginsengisoli TaxID=522298 RepID=A0ABS9SKD8_9BACT|nr:GNAT family N-acetyltransferase [Niabella ginsengisoli]MCH5598815.1 GNAT family N-acetyltransferase [Niabella ginsengisoli]
MITIRKASIDDLSVLLEFEQGIVEAERPYDSTMIEAHFHYYDIEEMLKREDCAIVVAEVDGQLVASGSARIQKGKPYNNFNSYAFLGFMYVSPAFRGQGLNQKIVDSLLEWSQSKGLTEVRLQVYSENNNAIRAYEKIGFKPILTEMRLIK